MADQNKFENMLEKLVNEDRAGAEELFHEIVVEKSRDIYESLLEDDLAEVEETAAEVEESTDEEVDETTDEEVDEATDEEVDETTDEDKVDENFDLDEFEVEADPMEADPADDMMGDIEDAMDGEEGEGEGEEELEDRVVDIEDALDDLKAEFEKMIAGDDAGDEEESDDEEDDGEEDDDSEEESFNFEATDEEVDEATDEEEVDEADEDKSEAETMREYVEKVTHKQGEDNKAKSPVASANDMGGEAGNIAQGGEESGRTAESAKEEDAGNVNKPGGKASKSLKGDSKGHGAEKKSAGETADNKKSVVGK